MISRRIFSLIITVIAFATAAVSASNIVITEYHNDYYVVVGKDGVTPVKITNKQTATFMALRTPATAIMHTYYDDFITIDKAKAKGGKPIYAKAKSAGIFFDDSRVCYLPVPLEKLFTESTATIELTFQKPEFCTLVDLYDIYPVLNYYFSLHLPIALKDRFDIELSNPPADYEVDKSLSDDGKEFVISLVARNLPEIYKEDDSPSVRHFAPYLTILGCFLDVDELYTRYNSYVDRFDPRADIVLAKATEITRNCKDDISKIDSIQKWVHDNIRYVAIENGDLGHSPDLPSGVLEKRFGDCKGSASLIVGMLRSLGIDGRLTWIGTSSIPEDWTSRPAFSTGNHMIASVVLTDTILYIDGTTGPADFGFLPSAIQGKQTIIEDGDKCIIGRVPVLAPAANTDSIVTVLSLEDKGLSGTMSDFIIGTYKAQMINIIRSIDSKKRDKALISKLSLGRKNVRFSSIVTDGFVPDGGTGLVKADIAIPNVITDAGAKAYLSITSTLPNLSLLYLIDTKDRHNPATLSSRRRVICENIIKLPDDYESVTLPEDSEISNRWFSSSITYNKTSEDNVISYKFVFTINETEIPLEDIASYNSDIKLLIKALAQNIILINKL